jgi:hypothetical protein
MAGNFEKQIAFLNTLFFRKIRCWLSLIREEHNIYKIWHKEHLFCMAFKSYWVSRHPYVVSFYVTYYLQHVQVAAPIGAALLLILYFQPVTTQFYLWCLL